MNICLKLIKWDTTRILPLLDLLLIKMGRDNQLSLACAVEPLADDLVRADPNGAWETVKAHLEETLPEWRGHLLHWLKGDIYSTFDEVDS